MSIKNQIHNPFEDGLIVFCLMMLVSVQKALRFAVMTLTLNVFRPNWGVGTEVKMTKRMMKNKE